MRRIAAFFVIAAGLGMIALMVVNNMFTVAPAHERLMDDFRPFHDDAFIQDLRADGAALLAVEEEYTTKVTPTLAGTLGMTPEEFNAMVESEYPDVAVGIEGIPGIAERHLAITDTLDAEQEQFESADAIPTADQPAYVMPWMVAGGGLLVVLGGLWLLWRPGVKKAFAVAAVGALLGASTFVLSLPGKAADTDQMNANLGPTYTAEMVAQGQADLITLDAMATQLEGEMLPDMAARIGITTEQLEEITAEQFPAIAAATQDLPEALARNAEVADTFEARLADYETAGVVALEPIVWWDTALAGVVLLAGLGFALMMLRPSRREVTEFPVPPAVKKAA